MSAGAGSAAWLRPAGWTYRTALNVVKPRHRRLRLERQLHLRRTSPDRADWSSPPDWSVEVWDALGRLPQRERTAIALRYVADLATTDVARAGVAPGTVGSTLHAARRHLATALADQLEEATDA